MLAHTRFFQIGWHGTVWKICKGLFRLLRDLPGRQFYLWEGLQTTDKGDDSLIKNFEDIGAKTQNALESRALLELCDGPLFQK